MSTAAQIKSTYNHFDRATRDIRAAVLIHNGKPVGRIVVKYGKRGSDEMCVRAFFQLYNTPMFSFYTKGYGYDHAKAALDAAIMERAFRWHMRLENHTTGNEEARKLLNVIFDAYRKHPFSDWHTILREAGIQYLDILD